MAGWRYRMEVDSSAQRLNSVGPLIAGAWSRQNDELGREIRGEFLIDTGAYGAMIDLEIAEALQLTLHGTREVHGIHGYGRLQQYLGRVSLLGFAAGGRRTVYSVVIECVGVRRCAIRIASTAPMSSVFSAECSWAIRAWPSMERLGG